MTSLINLRVQTYTRRASIPLNPGILSEVSYVDETVASRGYVVRPISGTVYSYVTGSNSSEWGTCAGEPVVSQSLALNYPAQLANLGEGKFLGAKVSIKLHDLRGDVEAATKITLFFEGAENLVFYGDSNNVDWSDGDLELDYFRTNNLPISIGLEKRKTYFMPLFIATKPLRYATALPYYTIVGLRVVNWGTNTTVYMETKTYEVGSMPTGDFPIGKLVQEDIGDDYYLGFGYGVLPGVMLSGQEDLGRLTDEITSKVEENIEGRYTAI